MRYFYLHGFASSPKSRKAQYLSDRLAEHNQTLEIPDFNQGGFANLTLTRQLNQMTDLLGSDRAVLLGSSFGGLTAAYLGDRLGDQIAQLILLAPAFGFPQRWRDRLSPEKQQQWETTGELMVYHYGEGRELPLHDPVAAARDRVWISGQVVDPAGLAVARVAARVVVAAPERARRGAESGHARQ